MPETVSVPTGPQRPAPWAPPAPGELRPTSETPRLTIRPFIPADAPALFHAVDTSRPTLVPWLPWAPERHRSLEDSQRMIDVFARSHANPLAPENSQIGGYVMGVFNRESGSLVGGTGFNRLDPSTLNAETGYWLCGSARRQGFATEACSAMLDWGFAPQSQGGFGFRRIHIFAASANLASCAVPRRLGLHQHMQSTADRWIDGLGFTGTTGWEVLADDWRARRVDRGYHPPVR